LGFPLKKVNKSVFDLNNVQHNSPARLPLHRVKIEHVPEGAVGQRWAENGNVVAPSPIAKGSRVANLLAQAMDQPKAKQIDEKIDKNKLMDKNLGRRPADIVSFLLFQTCVQNWHQPLLKFAIVLIWDQQVAGPVYAVGPEPLARHFEGA
jgi:hypothetical protein